MTPDADSSIISAVVKMSDQDEDLETCSMDHPCPPWFVRNTTTCKCECFHDNFKGIINCDQDNQSASVLDCYCATYNSSGDYTLVGSCFYNCENSQKSLKDVLYHTFTDEDDSICSPFHRKGIFCGECNDSYFPLAYSFNLACMQCDHDGANWVILVILATLPSTLFVILVIFLRISVTSSYLHGFVLFSQGISFPANMRIILRTVVNTGNSAAIIGTKIIASLYGFWILDFFRPLLPPICLRLTTLQVLSLDYIVAVYPLILITLAYIVATLYYHNCKVVVYATYPFRKVFSQLQRPCNIKASLMDAYATFFILSYAKFLSASFDLLMPTSRHSTNNPNTATFAAYYDASLEYFEGDHLPLGLTALAVLVVFVLLPTLVLLLYPFRFTQIVLTKLKLNNSLLDLFVNPFYTCYKDGSEPNTRDCRWFSAMFLILRIILPLLYSFTLGSVFLPLAVIIIFIFVMILITVKPHKSAYSHFIKFDVTFLLLLALFYLSMISIDVSSIKDHRLVHASYALTVVFGVIPLVYVVLVVLYWMVSKCKGNFSHQLLGRVFSQWQFKQYEMQDSCENDEPDRLMNPTEYLNKTTSLRATGSVGDYSNKQTY